MARWTLLTLGDVPQGATVCTPEEIGVRRKEDFIQCQHTLPVAFRTLRSC